MSTIQGGPLLSALHQSIQTQSVQRTQAPQKTQETTQIQENKPIVSEELAQDRYDHQDATVSPETLQTMEQQAVAVEHVPATSAPVESVAVETPSAPEAPTVGLSQALQAELAAAEKAPANSAPVAEVSAPVTSAPVAEVSAPVSSAPEAEVSAPVTSAPVAEVSAPVTSAPEAEVSAPVTSAPVAEVSAPVASAPVAEVSAPVASAPVAEVSAPVASAPVAEVSAPVEENSTEIVENLPEEQPSVTDYYPPLPGTPELDEFGRKIAPEPTEREVVDHTEDMPVVAAHQEFAKQQTQIEDAHETAEVFTQVDMAAIREEVPVEQTKVAEPEPLTVEEIIQKDTIDSYYESSRALVEVVEEPWVAEASNLEAMGEHYVPINVGAPVDLTQVVEVSGAPEYPVPEHNTYMANFMNDT